MKKIFLLIIFAYMMQTTVISQDFSTRGEIYDYEIGDIFHYNSEATSFWSSGFQDVTNIEIIGKYYSTQEDTINYVRVVQNRRRELYDGNFEPWEYSYWTDSVSYSDLDSLIISCFQCYTYYDSNYYNGRLINRFYEQYIEQNVYKKYVVGCGRAEYNLSDASYGYVDSVLVYYKKGDEEWGQQLTVGISEQYNTENDFIIYPNPAKTEIFITDNNTIFLKEINIYNQLGQKVLHEKGISNKIDVSKIGQGMYIVELIRDKSKYRQKLIIE